MDMGDTSLDLAKMIIGLIQSLFLRIKLKRA